MWTSTRRVFPKIQHFLYPEYDPDLSQNVLTSSYGFILFIFVLRHVQQPGSYCDGKFMGGGTSAYNLLKILHCKPLGIDK